MVRLKSTEDIDKLRLSGEILSATFRHLESEVKPGVSTWQLDKMADEFIRSHGAVPSFYKYRGFPGHICTSVNENRHPRDSEQKANPQGRGYRWAGHRCRSGWLFYRFGPHVRGWANH